MDNNTRGTVGGPELDESWEEDTFIPEDDDTPEPVKELDFTEEGQFINLDKSKEEGWEGEDDDDYEYDEGC